MVLPLGYIHIVGRLRDWIWTLPYFKQYNIKLWVFKDILSLSPVKDSPKATAIWQKVEMRTNNTLYTFQDVKSMAKTCAFKYPTLSKVGINLFDAQKGETGRILNCIGIFKTPKIALIISLMLWNYYSKVVSQMEKKQLHTHIQVSLIIRHKTP